MFVCFDVHTTALNHGFQVVCMFDFFCYSYVLHRTSAYIHKCKRGWIQERERERWKKSNTSTKPRSLSLCMHMCMCISLSILSCLVYKSSSLSFVYILDEKSNERITTIECDLISSTLANQCVFYNLTRERACVYLEGYCVTRVIQGNSWAYK